MYVIASASLWQCGLRNWPTLKLIHVSSSKSCAANVLRRNDCPDTGKRLLSCVGAVPLLVALRTYVNSGDVVSNPSIESSELAS